MKSWDDSLWMKDIYRKFKHTITDEQDVYDNTASSVTLFRARTINVRANSQVKQFNQHSVVILNVQKCIQLYVKYRRSYNH